MAVQKYPKGSQIWITKNFQAREFDCPCRSLKCVETLVDAELAAGLQRVREALACSVQVTSGYRCAYYQKDLARRGYETAKNSQHLLGRAVDLRTGHHTGDQLEAVARGCGFKAVGVARAWIHVDLRGPAPRRWSYSHQ